MSLLLLPREPCPRTLSPLENWIVSDPERGVKRFIELERRLEAAVGHLTDIPSHLVPDDWSNNWRDCYADWDCWTPRYPDMGTTMKQVFKIPGQLRLLLYNEDDHDTIFFSAGGMYYFRSGSTGMCSHVHRGLTLEEILANINQLPRIQCGIYDIDAVEEIQQFGRFQMWPNTVFEE